MMYDQKENEIIKWLDLEIKTLQDCPKNCDEKKCESKIITLLHVRNTIFTGAYHDRINKLTTKQIN